ncbi:MAG: histidine kinase, partial [Clostridia bacterium]|nr:histidine kinase [Clostridia bacterium]
KRRDQVNEENRNLRIQMFSTQIKPHFILNTVGAIRTLIKTDGDKASELLYEFSKYIRTNLEEKDYTKYIPFLEELDYIETYLKLEKARFGDRINVEYDIENKSFWVLPLTIQPFVENAVKHGLFPSANGGTLKISTRSTAKGAVVIIQDNGVGFDAYRIQDILETKKSMGMKSSILRIEKEMGGKVIVESSCVPGDSGTKITIELPLRGKKNENDNR